MQSTVCSVDPHSLRRTAGCRISDTDTTSTTNQASLRGTGPGPSWSKAAHSISVIIIASGLLSTMVHSLSRLDLSTYFQMVEIRSIKHEVICVN